MVYKEKEESMERVKDECKPVMLKHIVTRDMCKSLVIMVAVNLLLLSVEGSHYNHRNHRISSDERQSNHKNCSRCSLAHEDVKSRRIEQFKREFLQKLGLKEEPKIQHIDKSLYNIPPLLHTYESTIKANNRLTNKLLDDEMMLGDQPYSMPPDNLNQVEDESTIKKIISFANPRESIFFLFPVSYFASCERGREQFTWPLTVALCPVTVKRVRERERARPLDEVRSPPVT